LTASNICAAVRTSVRSTPAGVASETGPLTSVTSAPASRHARATANPIFPELALVIMRTGSIGSSVGPAVISTRLPDSAFGWKTDSISPRISSASSMRPMPTSPHAWSPGAGPATRMPSSRSASTFLCVAAFSHISTFIAGAIISGQRRASTSVESRSSARPCATLAMKSAVAGATTIRSRSRDSSMWPMLSGTRGSHRSLHAVWPVSACSVAVPMKRSAAGGQHRADIAPGLHQQARELGGLVGSDAAGQSEQNPLSFQCHRDDGPAR
jgi:hypothetical protein